MSKIFSYSGLRAIMTNSNNLEEQKDIYGNSNDQVASVFGFIRELAKIKNKKIFHVKDVEKKIWIDKIKQDQLPGIRFGDGHQTWGDAGRQFANSRLPAAFKRDSCMVEGTKIMMIQIGIQIRL